MIDFRAWKILSKSLWVYLLYSILKQNIQNFRVDMNETQTKDKKDKQLEDLNETL